MGQQRIQRARCEKRHVAREQHQCAVLVAKDGLRLQQRVSGSQLWLLSHKGEPIMSRQRVAHGVGFVSDDEGGGERAERRGGGQHVLDHRKSGDPVEDLWNRRLHARSLAGGKDHDVNVHV